jgi:hypothetical protein
MFHQKPRHNILTESKAWSTSFAAIIFVSINLIFTPSRNVLVGVTIEKVAQEPNIGDL